MTQTIHATRIDDLIQQHCPNGVRYMPLSEVAAYSRSRVSATELDSTSFVGVDNLVADKGGRVDATHRPNTASVTAYQSGDILIGNIRPYLKKIWLADSDGGCSGDVLAVQIKQDARDQLAPEFLYYVLSSESFFAYNMQNAKGAKMPRGDKNAIMRYPIPVPPLVVQEEIVRILDTFTQLEAELEAELEARRQQYEHYRGQLFTNASESEQRLLGELAEFKYGFTAKAAADGAFRFLRITDIEPNGSLSETGAKYVDIDESADNYVVERDDLLMARTGATYGKTMIFESEEPSVYASFLIRIRFKKPNILPRYYWHFAQSHLYWSQADALVSSGSQPQFNANALKQVQVPVPPLAEQERIIAVLDQFDALTNGLSIGLPAEIVARRQQYEFYRDRLLSFEELRV